MENKTDRPTIQIELNDRDRMLEKLALWLLIALWAGAIAVYFTLPDKIPVHFNIKNEIDKWDDKAYIFMFPFIASLLYVLLSWVNKYPQNFNYTEPVTEENAEAMYRSATKLLRSLKLVIIVGFIVETIDDVIIVKYPGFNASIVSVMLQWSSVVLVAGCVLLWMLKKPKQN